MNMYDDGDDTVRCDKIGIKNNYHGPVDTTQLTRR